MSNTTAIPVIKSVSSITEQTINKLYHHHGIHQPRKVHVNHSNKRINLFTGKEITIEEVHSNTHHHSTKHIPIISQHIVEEHELTPYMNITYKYDVIN